jgi:NTE family protein
MQKIGLALGGGGAKGLAHIAILEVLDDCDLVIAVNVMGTRTESTDLVPSMAEAVFNTFQIMQASILRHKLERDPPDILVSPDIVDVQMLEFYKAVQVLSQAEAACSELRNRLRDLGFTPGAPVLSTGAEPPGQQPRPPDDPGA